MKITSLRIRVLNNTGNKMVGLVSITLGDMIAIHDIKILNNQNQLFLAMPSRTTKAGSFKDIVHPINAPVRETIEKISFDAYEKCINENIGTAQYDVNPDFNGVLTEQSIEDFILVSTKEVSDYATNTQSFSNFGRNQNSKSNDSIGTNLSKWLEG